MSPLKKKGAILITSIFLFLPLGSWVKDTCAGGEVKMAEEKDGEITFSSTNSSKEQQNGEQSLQNNF